MKFFILTALFIIVFTACNNLSPKEKELRANLDKPLLLEPFKAVQQGNIVMPFEEFRQQHSHLSVVYLQNSCSPCYPKFIEWQNKMDSIDTPDNFTVLFVIGGEDYSEFMENVLDIQYVEDKFYTIMDTEFSFMENNEDIPRWIIDSSMLIDGKNKIKMVGAPFATPEMTELFYEIVTSKV